jgi:hypothetical protein
MYSGRRIRTPAAHTARNDGETRASACVRFSGDKRPLIKRWRIAFVPKRSRPYSVSACEPPKRSCAQTKSPAYGLARNCYAQRPRWSRRTGSASFRRIGLGGDVRVSTHLWQSFLERPSASICDTNGMSAAQQPALTKNQTTGVQANNNTQAVLESIQSIPVEWLPDAIQICATRMRDYFSSHTQSALNTGEPPGTATGSVR